MSRVLLFAAAVLALTTCGVDLPDVSGLACDEQHECRAPRECINGICVEPGGEEDGGVGGGSAGGGGGGAGGGGSSVGGGNGGGGIGGGAGGGTGGAAGGGAGGGGAAGGAGGGGVGGGGAGGGMGGGGGIIAPPLWKQSVHGFTGQSVLGTATLEVDTLRGNRVVSTIKNASDQNDRATANQMDGGRLPKTGHGKIRGKFQIPSTLKLNNNSTFLWLSNGSKQLIQLYFNASGQLVTYSAPGMLAPGAVSNTITWTNGFQPNIDYLVEIAWQRNSYRRVWINGTQVAQAINLTGDAGVLEIPDQLRLGVYRYDGTADAGWAVTLFDWSLTDNPQVVLTD